MWGKRPAEHEDGLARVAVALEGISLGDAFGAAMSAAGEQAEAWIETRTLPPGPWKWTDDTLMAARVAGLLRKHGAVDQDRLSESLVAAYKANPDRGWGTTTRSVLAAVAAGKPWRDASGSMFLGLGSMGNGAAKRAAVVGAYFCDDFETASHEAVLAAQVTHHHAEGQAAAAAVAVASAWAARSGKGHEPQDGLRMLQYVLDFTPDGQTREGVARALMVPEDLSVWSATGWLGNGSRRTAADTIPFCLWCAAAHLESLPHALWAAVSAGGDRDTNCAIVGGIVALSVGRTRLPADWFARREPLPG